MIRQEIGRIILAELSDPRIGFVTLTRVEVAPDFSLAKVHVSVMDTPAKQRATLQGLNSARRRIQLALGDRMNLRRTPAVLFVLDAGVKHSIHISSLLADLARERGEAPAGDTQATEPAEDDPPDEGPDKEDPESHDG